MSHSDQALALAGCMQAAMLVDQIATGKTIDPSSLRLAVESILNTEPKSVADLYQGSHNLRDGLMALRSLLGKEPQALSHHSRRYFLSLLHLSAKLNKQKPRLQQLSELIQKSQRQKDYFDDATHSSLVASLAQAYQECISPLGLKIHVIGDPKVLQQSRNAEQIRTLLLFGIRSAFLWRQLGGNQWRLFFQRQAMSKAVQQWLLTSN